MEKKEKEGANPRRELGAKDADSLLRESTLKTLESLGLSLIVDEGHREAIFSLSRDSSATNESHAA